MGIEVALPTIGTVVRMMVTALACFLAYSAFLAWLIRDGAVPLVFLYEQDVQEVAIGQGLITHDQLAENRRRFVIASYVILLAGLVVVYCACGTRDAFGLWWQATLYVWLWNAYDHFVIDTLWVGHTNAWQIPGAEGWDYIPKGTKDRKRLAIGLLAPVGAGALAAVGLVLVRLIA